MRKYFMCFFNLSDLPAIYLQDVGRIGDRKMVYTSTKNGIFLVFLRTFLRRKARKYHYLISASTKNCEKLVLASTFLQ